MTSGAETKGRGRKIGAIIAALLVAAISIWSAAFNEWTANQPRLLAGIAPRSGGALIYRALQKAQSEQLNVSPDTVAIAEKAAIAAPVAAEPLIIAGIARLAARQEASAAPLFLEARHRDPRSSLARLMVLDTYLRENKDEEALGEIAALFRVLPLARTPLIKELARRAYDPRLKGALGRILLADSNLLPSVLQQLSAEGADPALILELAGPHASPGHRDQDLLWQRADRQWQSALIRSLIRKGDYRQAHAIWTQFFAPKAMVAGNFIYDPEFRSIGTPPPFGWQLTVSDAGVSESAHGSGLFVEFYGRKNAVMAQQTLLMTGGNYRLTLVGTHVGAVGERPLRWLLTCLPSRSRILDWSYPTSGRGAGATFSVPSGGCDAQVLALTGSAGEFPRSQTVTIEKIGIVREN